jgi:hypothetical protein
VEILVKCRQVTPRASMISRQLYFSCKLVSNKKIRGWDCKKMQTQSRLYLYVCRGGQDVVERFRHRCQRKPLKWRWGSKVASAKIQYIWNSEVPSSQCQIFGSCSYNVSLLANPSTCHPNLDRPDPYDQNCSHQRISIQTSRQPV